MRLKLIRGERVVELLALTYWSSGGNCRNSGAGLFVREFPWHSVDLRHRGQSNAKAYIELEPTTDTAAKILSVCGRQFPLIQAIQ